MQVKIGFDNWKKLAKDKIKEFNSSIISEEELIERMKKIKILNLFIEIN